MPSQFANAADVLSAAVARIDLNSWTDDPLEWVSSSVSESNPGKRYHRGWCEVQDKVKRPTTYLKTVAEIAHQVCSCSTDDSAARSGQVRYALSRWLEDFTALTAAVVDGTFVKSDHLTYRLRENVYLRGETVLSGALRSFVQEVLNIHAAQVAHGLDPYAVAACADALLPDFHYRSISRGAQSEPMPDVPAALKSLAATCGPYRKAWAEFRTALEAGTDVRPAADVVLAQMGPVTGKPHQIDELEQISVAATQAGQVITTRDFLAPWRSAATAARRQIVDGWAQHVLENIEHNDRAGYLTIRVPAHSGLAQTQFGQTSRDALFDELTGRYEVDRVARTVRVPAAVAYHVHRRWAGEVIAGPGADEQFVRTAAQLVEAKMPWLTAYATARAVVDDVMSSAA